MEQIQQSLAAMSYLKGTIYEKLEFIMSNLPQNVEGSKEPNMYMDQGHLDAFRKMIVLDTCSFMDEYDNFFGPLTGVFYDKRVREIKLICKPFMNQLREWKDLKTYRNTVIAHNIRDKNNNIVLIDKEINSLNVPITTLDFIMLHACVESTINTIAQEFGTEFIECFEKLNAVKYSAQNKSEITLENCESIISSLILRSQTEAIKANRFFIYYTYSFNKWFKNV